MGLVTAEALHVVVAGHYSGRYQMVLHSVLSEEQLLGLLDRCAGDRLRMELLAFWSRHPNAKFTARAVSCALDCKRLNVSKALAAMVEVGLVDTHDYNGTPVYSLTANEETRRPILELASLGGGDLWRLMVKSGQQRHSVVG